MKPTTTRTFIKTILAETYRQSAAENIDDFAAMMGVSRSAMYRYMNGESNPNGEVIASCFLFLDDVSLSEAKAHFAKEGLPTGWGGMHRYTH